MDEGLSIGEVARRAGIQPSALRYYERVGLFEPPRRVSGQRRYTAEVFDTLRLVALAQRAGFTIVQIRELLRGFDPDTPASERWQALAPDKLVEVRRRIDDARRIERVLKTLLECRCSRLEDCVRDSAAPSI